MVKNISNKKKKKVSVNRRDLWDDSHTEDHFYYSKREKIRKSLHSRDKHSKIFILIKSVESRHLKRKLIKGDCYNKCESCADVVLTLEVSHGTKFPMCEKCFDKRTEFLRLLEEELKL